MGRVYGYVSSCQQAGMSCFDMGVWKVTFIWSFHLFGICICPSVVERNKIVGDGKKLPNSATRNVQFRVLEKSGGNLKVNFARL